MPKLRPQERASHAVTNAIAARIILADPQLYDGGLVDWARRWQQRYPREAAAYAMTPLPPARQREREAR